MTTQLSDADKLRAEALALGMSESQFGAAVESARRSVAGYVSRILNANLRRLVSEYVNLRTTAR